MSPAKRWGLLFSYNSTILSVHRLVLVLFGDFDLCWSSVDSNRAGNEHDLQLARVQGVHWQRDDCDTRTDGQSHRDLWSCFLGEFNHFVIDRLFVLLRPFIQACLCLMCTLRPVRTQDLSIKKTWVEILVCFYRDQSGMRPIWRNCRTVGK